MKYQDHLEQFVVGRVGANDFYFESPAASFAEMAAEEPTIKPFKLMEYLLYPLIPGVVFFIAYAAIRHLSADTQNHFVR